MSYLVLDVSKYNAISDYSAAAGDVDGVLIRVGYRGYSGGSLATDSSFVTHYNGFKNTGIKIGYYWFTQAISESEAIAEADYVYSLIKDKICDFPIYIDSEYSNNNHNGRADSLSASDRTKYIIAFCNRIIKLGYRAGVYASDSWFVSQLDWSTLSGKGYSIWDASYSSNKPSRISGYDAWQYTSSGTISGCSSRVDLSYFYNDVAGWSTSTSYNIEDCTIDTSAIGEIVYWGGENKPAPVVKNSSGTTLTLGTHYTISYADNINAGKAAIVIRGIGNYSGTQTAYFTISPRNLSNATANCGSQDKFYCYDTDNIAVESDLGGQLVKDVDYYVEIQKELATNDIGYTYYDTVFTVYGMNNWAGNITSSHFNTRVFDVSKITFTLTDTNLQYTSAELKPTVSNKQVMTEGTDYTVEYSNNINAGTATVTITGKGDYNGITSLSFIITPINISSLDDISLSSTEFTYTGKEIVPDISSATLESIKTTDYVITYGNNINVSTTAIVTVKGASDNCIGNKLLEFSITAKDLSSATISCGEPTDGLYDLEKLSVSDNSINLTKDKDYTVNIKYGATPADEDKVDGADYAKVTITGIGNYTGTASKIFAVNSKYIDINSLNPTISGATTYTGEELTIDITYDGLESDKDYTVTNGTHIDAGTYKVTIKGIGNYTGEKIVDFVINPIEVTSENCAISYGEVDENGIYKVDNYSVSVNEKVLIKDTDYTINGSEKNDENYEFKLFYGSIDFKGNYSGSIELEEKKIGKLTNDISTVNFVLSQTIYTYTGSEIKPELIIDSTDYKLEENIHYTVSYSNNIDVGTGNITINGIGGFAGSSKQLQFTILPLSLASIDITLKKDSFEYSGESITLEFVKPDSIEYDITYTVSDYENTDAGSYIVILTGTGNFTDQKQLQYNITAKDITNLDDIVITSGDPDDNGYYNLDNLKVTYKNTELNLNSDYIISKIEVAKFTNVEYTESTVYIEGINNFVGTKSAIFKTKRTYININTLNISLDNNSYTYTGEEIKPQPVFGDDANMVEGTDYKLQYHSNIESGAAVLIIYGMGDYNGSKSIQFYIDPYNITTKAKLTCEGPDEDGYYDLSKLTVSIPDLNKTLIKETDYTISTSVSIVGDKYVSKVIITGTGNYTGEISDSYPTGKVYIDIDTVEISIPNDHYQYTGEAIKFDLITDLEKDVDYSVEFSNNIELGTAIITITGIGNYSGTRVINFEIIQRDISDDGVVTCGDPDNNGYYNLDNLNIAIDNNNLVLDKDYELSINAEIVNSANVLSHLTITGIGNYTGSIKVDYLTGKYLIDISNISFTLDKYEYDYASKVITPEVQSSLIEDFDYKVSYSNNINAGVAVINITGIGNYSGNKQLAFTINMLDLSTGTITCGEPDGSGCYNMNNLKVIFNNMSLKEGYDYSIKIGLSKVSEEYTASTVNVTGINNFSGFLTATFQTERVFKDIRKYNFSLDKDTFVYTGSENMPEVICEELQKTRYLVYYENNINAGTGKVLIYGTRDYVGQLELEFTINPADISKKAFITCGEPDENGCYDINNAKVYLEYIDSCYMSASEYELNIEEIEEDDYITAKVTATGVGNYTGSVCQIYNVRKVEKKDDKPDNDNVDESKDYEPGKEITLDNVKVYPRYCSKKTDILKSGTYFIWNNYVINNRIRITTRAYNANVSGQIIGWIDVDVLSDKTNIEIGDIVEVNGKLTKYADGTGNTISKSGEYMYVVDLLNSDEYTNYIGLASGPNNTRQGWATLEMVKK